MKEKKGAFQKKIEVTPTQNRIVPNYYDNPMMRRDKKQPTSFQIENSVAEN